MQTSTILLSGTILSYDVAIKPVWGISCHSLETATQAVLFFLYKGQKLPKTPIYHTMPKTQRNYEIRKRHASGETVPDLADVFGLSQQRIHQILRGKQK